MYCVSEAEVRLGDTWKLHSGPMRNMQIRNMNLSLTILCHEMGNRPRMDADLRLIILMPARRWIFL
jgi:hypothetical protein